MTHEVFVIAASIGTLANCLALRVLGCKLVRPNNTASDGPVKCKVSPAQAAGIADHCWAFDELLA